MIITLVLGLIFCLIGVYTIKYPDRLYNLSYKWDKKNKQNSQHNDDIITLRIKDSPTYRGISEFIIRIFGALFTLGGIIMFFISISLICNSPT